MDKEILDGFREESNGLLKELREIVAKLDDEDFAEFPDKLLADFSQRIDRIMGAAKTIATEAPSHAGLTWISKLSEVCKALGYKAKGQKNLNMLPIFSAFWADTIDAIEELLDLLDDPAASAKSASEFLPTLQKRLQWLLSKVATPTKESSQQEVDEMLKNFGKS